VRQLQESSHHRKFAQQQLFGTVQLLNVQMLLTPGHSFQFLIVILRNDSARIFFHNFYGRTLSDASMLYFADVFFHLFLWPP